MPADDGTLFVNFASLHQASADINNALNKLKSSLQQVEQDAKPLVETWDGDAKQAYQQRQTTWQNAASDLSTMLGDIRKAVDESASGYSDTERRNTALF